MPNAANFAAQLDTLVDGPLAVDTHYYRVKVGGSTDATLQWVDNTGDGVATFVVYGSIYSDDRVKDLNPATNKHWHDETARGAVFDLSPAGAPGNGTLPLIGNPALYYLLVEVVVTVPFARFELGVRTQNRNA